MNRKLLSVALALILLAVFIGLFLINNFQPDERAEIEVNVCIHLPDYDNQTISHLRDLGVGCVRTDWLTNNNSMTDYSQKLQDSGIKLLAIMNVSTYPILDSVPEEWNRTVTEIVTSEGFNNTDAVEICNEPNGDAFISPDIYYELLKSAYTIIRNYTSIPVVFAGLSPNSELYGFTCKTYLNAVFAHNDVQDNFDYMGIHVYPDISENLDALQFVKNLTTKPIWITEAGETSSHDGEPAQAEYLRSVYYILKPLVNKTFIYELKDKGSSTDPEDHFGLLTVGGTKKESYNMVLDIKKNERTASADR